MINVLLSTYNGECFVEELIGSVRAQEGVDLRLIVRDDGSCDGTVGIVQEMALRHDNIIFKEGGNIGACSSFLSLLDEVPAGDDYCAFCDQDDVWMPGKLRRAVRFISQTSPSIPVLYCSGYQVVDAGLARIGNSRPFRIAANMKNALVEVPGHGCTMVLNRAAIRLLQQARPDRNRLYMHDFWVYQVVAAMGEVVLDDMQTVLYRQHGANAIGAASGRQRIWKWMRRMRSSVYRKRCHHQLEQLLICYGNILERGQRNIIEDFLCAVETGGLKRLFYALNCGITRQSRWDTLVTRCIIGLGLM